MWTENKSNNSCFGDLWFGIVLDPWKFKLDENHKKKKKKKKSHVQLRLRERKKSSHVQLRLRECKKTSHV